MTDVTDLTRSLKDAAYVAVGFGVLGFQRAQVRRRQLAKQLQEQRPEVDDQARSDLGSQLAQTRAQLAELGQDLERLMQPALVELGERVEPLLDQLEPHVPDPARPAWSAVRGAARQTRQQLEERLQQAPGAGSGAGPSPS